MRKAGPVLLVDDDDDSREAFREVLETAGFEVLEARTGEEALRAIREFGQELGLVLLDLRLPGLTGDEVLERAGARFRSEVPVVLMSASRGPFKLPVRAALTKPFDLEKLLQVVEQHVRRF